MRSVAGFHVAVHRPRELADQPEADTEVAVGIRRAEHVAFEAAFVRVFELTGPVDVVFNANLRTRAGAPVFSAEYMLQLDPAYTPPPVDSCAVFQ